MAGLGTASEPDFWRESYTKQSLGFFQPQLCLPPTTFWQAPLQSLTSYPVRQFSLSSLAKLLPLLEFTVMAPWLNLFLFVYSVCQMPPLFSTFCGFFFSYELYLIWILSIHLFNCINMFAHLSLELRLCDVVMVTAMGEWFMSCPPPSKAYPESSISAAILPTTSQIRTTFIFSTGRLLVVPYSWFSSLNGTLAKSIHCYQKQQPSEISMMLSYLDSPGLCLFNTPTHPIFCLQLQPVKNLFKSLLSYTGITKLFPGQKLWLRIQLLYP